MESRTVVSTLVAAALLANGAFAKGRSDQQKAMEAARKYQEQYAAGQAAAAPAAAQAPEVVELAESDVKRYIAAVTELKGLGLRLEQESSSRGPGSAFQAIEGSEEALAVVKENGFTVERLSQVAYSIAMALASSDVKPEEIAEARAQSLRALEQMKGRLPPEQLELMKRQMGASMKAADQVRDQPRKNVELVAKYRSQLEAVHR